MTTPKGPMRGQKETNQEDNGREHINSLEEVKELLRDEPSEQSLEFLFDHYHEVPHQYQEKIVDYVQEATKIKVGLIGTKATEHLKALLPKSHEHSDRRKEGPSTTEIAQEIITSGNFKTFRDNEAIYYFNGGVYVRNGETRIKEIIHERLKGEESSQFCGEVIGKVQRGTYLDRSSFSDHEEHKIVIQNGILDLDTIELSSHTPDWLTLTKFPVRFDKDAKCPKIMKFIEEVARQDDVLVLQEWVGYNLWIFGYPAQKAMLLVGEGGNGKSTFIGLLEALVGRENRSAVSLHELEENRFAKHDLYGKAANLYPDLPDKDLKSTGIFKMLTGGDPIRAEDKNVRAFTYHNVAKLTFSCNTVPKVPEDSTAYFRRWLIIEFPYSFEGSDKEDKDLKEKIISDPAEMSGFLNWALEGLRRLRSNGWHFSNGKTVETVREDYIVRSDPYKAFALHCIKEEANGEAKKDDLYQAYRDHCVIHKVAIRSRDAFFKNFKDQFRPGLLSDYRPSKEENPERPRMFKGISLVERDKWCNADSDHNDDQDENDKVIWTQDPPQHGGLIGQVGPKSVQGVHSVQLVDPHVGYPHVGQVGQPTCSIRVCTQNPGPLNPFKKLRKGITFRIHKDEISSYKFYEFSREPEKGEVLDKEDDIHFIEAFKAAEIPDRQKRAKQLLILLLAEKPDKKPGSIQRRLSDLDSSLSTAEIVSALKELAAMSLIYKSEDGLYMPGREALK